MNVKKRALALGSALMLFAATSHAQTWSEVWQDTIDLQKSSWSASIKLGGGYSNDLGIGGATFQRNVPSTPGKDDDTIRKEDISGYDASRITGAIGATFELKFYKYVGLSIDILGTGLFPNFFDKNARAHNFLGYGWGFTPTFIVQFLPLENTVLRGLEVQMGARGETAGELSSLWDNTRLKGVIGCGYAFPQDSLLGGWKVELRKAALVPGFGKRAQEVTDKGDHRTWKNGLTFNASYNVMKSLNWLNEDEE